MPQQGQGARFSPNETVDFVIVGSGAAGGIIAKELAGVIGQSTNPVPGTPPVTLASLKSVGRSRQKFAVKCALLPPT